MGKTNIFPYYGLWRKIYWIKKPTQFPNMGNKFPWISQCMGIFFTNSWKIDANTHIFPNHGFWAIFPVLCVVQSQQWKHQSDVWNLYSKLTIKTTERRQSRRYGVFIVNFEQILRIALMLPLLNLSK